MTDALARKLFTELKERTGQIPDADLDEFWATLERTTVDELIGEWKGCAFETGHPVNGLLAKANWFGKTMKSATEVLPIVCLDDDDNKVQQRQTRQGRSKPVVGGVPR